MTARASSAPWVAPGAGIEAKINSGDIVADVAEIFICVRYNRQKGLFCTDGLLMQRLIQDTFLSFKRATSKKSGLTCTRKRVLTFPREGIVAGYSLMTDLLKQLLHAYGLLYITVVQLEKERPRTTHHSLEEYYRSLGAVEPEEPILVVRVSKDGNAHFLHDVDPKTLRLEDHYSDANVTVWELPEDEYYFFKAFRPGISDLEKQLPSFILGMALVYAYTLFESYVADVIRLRLIAHPAQLGREKQISLAEILESEKEVLIQRMVDRELNRIMREPMASILDRLRTRLGFRTLTKNFDQETIKLSHIRNCLVHNSAKVDQKVAAAEQSLCFGQSIEVHAPLLQSAIHTFRKFAAAIDIAFEQLRSTGSDESSQSAR